SSSSPAPSSAAPIPPASSTPTALRPNSGSSVPGTLALATRAKRRHFSAVQKKSSRRLARVNALAEKLRFLPHLSEHERVLYAWSLAATPDERWQRSQAYLRSVRSSRPCAKKKSASK